MKTLVRTQLSVAWRYILSLCEQRLHGVNTLIEQFVQSKVIVCAATRLCVDYQDSCGVRYIIDKSKYWLISFGYLL